MGQPRFLVLFLSLLLLPSLSYGGTGVNPETGRLDLCLTVEEEDGSPSSQGCGNLEVTNGTLTDDGDGNFSLSTGGGGGNSFETISTPAGTSPVADSATDTLTLTETSFLTITGTAGTDTIDITQVTTDLGTDGLIAANAVALSTDTTGSYVANIGDCTGSEGQNCFVAGGDGDTLRAIGGTFTLGGVDGSNNEALQLDFETTANQVGISSNTSATQVSFSSLDVFLSGTGPDIRLTVTGGDTLHLGCESTGCFLSNSTDGVHYFSTYSGDNRIVLGVTGNVPSITLTTDGTGNGEVQLPTDSIGVDELDTIDAPADTEALTYDSATGRMEWAAGGGDTNADKEFWFPAPALLPLEAAESIPPIVKDTGTNTDMMTVDFDQTTDECRTVQLLVPPDITAGGTVTFSVVWYAASVTTNEAIWSFRHNSGVADGVDPDQALTAVDSGACTVAGTAGQIDVCTWTETQTNLAWAASDTVVGVICRDADAAGDDFSADAKMIGVGIRIPRS